MPARYTQNSGATLNIDVGGTTAGSGYDQLAVSGIATLGGTLTTVAIASYNPPLGMAFLPLTYGSHTNTFGTLNLNLGNGTSFQAAYNAGSLSLESVPTGTTVYWTNSSGGNWSTASNWSTGAVPTASDTAYIGLSGSTFTVTINSNVTVGGLRTDEALTDSADLVVENNLVVNNTLMVNSNSYLDFYASSGSANRRLHYQQRHHRPGWGWRAAADRRLAHGNYQCGPHHQRQRHHWLLLSGVHWHLAQLRHLRADRGAGGREIQPAERKRPPGQPDAYHPVPAERGALGGHPVDGRLPGQVHGLYQRPERPGISPPRYPGGGPRRPAVAG